MKNTLTSRRLPETGYIRQSELLTILPFSSATLWRNVKKQSFPSPVKLSERITAWNVEDIRAWMDQVQPSLRSHHDGKQ